MAKNMFTKNMLIYFQQNKAMLKSFSFNFNTNFSINGKNRFFSQGSNAKDLTPQQEYWLNRILRDYSGKVYFLAILFFALMIAVVIVASK